MTESDFRSCSLAYRQALTDAWIAKEKRTTERLRWIERATDRRFAALMAVFFNATRGTELTADDFLKGKRRRKKQNSNMAADAFFGPLVLSGSAKVVSANDSN